MRRRTRVIHLLPDLCRGGGQVVVAQLLDHMDRDCFEPHVVALGPPEDMADDFAALGCEPVLLRGNGMRSVLELIRVIRQIDPDLIHVHSGPDRKLGQAAALLTRVPVVGHLHSPWAHLEPMHRCGAPARVRGPSRLKAWLRTKIEHRAVFAYVAVGEAVAAFHAPHLRAPVYLVHNGIDTQRFLPATAETRSDGRRDLGVGEGSPVVVSVGRLAEGKGQDTLIEVTADLPDAHLVLLGDGEKRPDLEDLAGRLGIDGRVVFAGERFEVERLLVAADVFAMASVSEGLPLSVLEALSCGLPVVSYDLPGLRDVLSDGVDGLLVEFGDRAALTSALGTVLADPVRAASMGRAARLTAESRFDSRVMAAEVEAVYDAVLQRRNPSGRSPVGGGADV